MQGRSSYKPPGIFLSRGELWEQCWDAAHNKLPEARTKRMVESISLIIYATGIASGILALYVLRQEKWHFRLGISGSLILLGSVLLLRSYGLISATLSWTLVGSVMGVFLWFVYVSYGRERHALSVFPIFFGWFALVLVEIYLFPFPAILLFAYTSLALAISHSYDLSRTDIRTVSKEMRRSSRALALPFLIINERVRRLGRFPQMALVLFLSYFSFELALLLVVPTIVMVALSGATAFYILNLTMMGIILFARWEMGEGSIDKGPSERESN